ncbi:hypothetical protein K402DRAFT_449921 [Aulographum hederae CBS 113979]|uniref:DUF202 domain-containing protein n=1 Tax=Aulographum hederae CBS 113979 TaxID=1176131 RepID=A0A6G1HHV7_9PEZI|nr:hypothetical protein K402DRAFT_449921 [Aulographum hederae CBS 113979]
MLSSSPEQPALSIPPPTHHRSPSPEPESPSSPESDHELEATQLHTVFRRRRLSDASTQVDSFSIRRYRLERQEPRRFDNLRRFWNRHVSVSVPAKGRRDHLALERTFLGYLRTSLALSMTGVLIAQMFRLQRSVSPDMELGYFVLGVPMATVFIAAAMVVALVGALRFWRQQNAMVRGRVWAGGWEINLIMILSIVLAVALFVLLTMVNVRKEYNN